MADLRLGLARGLRPGLGVAISLPARSVRSRVEFSDLAGAPFAPVNGDYHHRNETLTGFGDVQISLVGSRPLGAWTLIGAAGVTAPTGRTVSNPFELGRLGIKHQHIQFGTGTWNPSLAIAARRMTGAFTLNASAGATLALYDNPRGYRAGDRYSAGLGASRMIQPGWIGSSGLSLSHELAEHWNGKPEDEGNLGRTDLFLGLGLTHTIGRGGALTLNVQLPLASQSVGSQVKIPVIASVGWSK